MIYAVVYHKSATLLVQTLIDRGLIKFTSLCDKVCIDYVAAHVHRLTKKAVLPREHVVLIGYSVLTTHRILRFIIDQHMAVMDELRA